MARRSAVAASAAADGAARKLDGGYLRLLDANRRVLAELRFGIPAFAQAEAGVAHATIEPTYKATASGIAETFEATAFDGTLMFMGKVGTELILDRPYIEAGATVTIGSFTYAERL